MVGLKAKRSPFTNQLLILNLQPPGGSPVTIRAGDLCTFKEGLSCTWDVKKPINKHYKFL